MTQVPQYQCVCLDVIIIVVSVVLESLILVTLFFGFDYVTDLGKEDLLRTRLQTIHGLVKVLWQLELPLALGYYLTQIVDVIDVAYLSELRFV